MSTTNDTHTVTDTEWLNRGEYELTTHYERLCVMSNFYELDNKGLYSDMDFWPRLASRINADPDLKDFPHVTSQVARGLVNWCLRLGRNLKTFEEQFFEDYGMTYEEYTVPSIDEEDEGEVVPEEPYDEGYW
jgi:hypothetical protein